MCLVIDKAYHPNFKPLIANGDIEVIKVLTFGNKGWTTPYQHKKIYFIFKRAILKSKMKRSSLYTDEVCEGIHSCLNEAKAKYVMAHSIGSLAFCAIVPKGSKFYYGTDGDIVSDKLIILKECVYI